MINKLNIYDNYYSWWKNIDKTILILIISFFIAGLFFSLVSTSIVASDRLNTNSYYFFIKHLVFILLGLSIMFLFSLVKSLFPEIISRVISSDPNILILSITFLSSLTLPGHS